MNNFVDVDVKMDAWIGRKKIECAQRLKEDKQEKKIVKLVQYYNVSSFELYVANVFSKVHSFRLKFKKKSSLLVLFCATTYALVSFNQIKSNKNSRNEKSETTTQQKTETLLCIQNE